MIDEETEEQVEEEGVPSAELVVSDRIEDFENELKKKRITNAVYLTSALVGAFFLWTVFTGGSFAQWAGGFGISLVNQKSGVYADCKRKENKGNAYCKPKVHPSQREWKGVTRGRSQFTLY